MTYQQAIAQARRQVAVGRLCRNCREPTGAGSRAYCCERCREVYNRLVHRPGREAAQRALIGVGQKSKRRAG